MNQYDNELRIWGNQMRGERRWKRATQQAYTRHVALFLAWLDEAEIDLVNVALGELIEYIDSRTDSAEQPWSSSTCHTAQVAIKHWTNWCAVSGVLPADPAVGWRTLRRDYPEAYAPTAREVKRLVMHWYHKWERNRGRVERLRNAAVIVLMAGAALRRSEVVALKVKHIARGDDFYVVTVGAGKGPRGARVPVGNLKRQDDLAAGILSAWLTVALAQLKLGPEDPLFPAIGQKKSLQREEWTGISTPLVWQFVREAVQKTGVSRDIHPHSLRHFFAVEALAAGMDLLTVSRLMRHGSLDATKPYLAQAAMRLGEVATTKSVFRDVPVKQVAGWSRVAPTLGTLKAS